MGIADNAQGASGRPRHYPSNAARQAAYRRRVRERQAALTAAAGGHFEAAVDQLETLAGQQVAALRIQRDRHRAARERAERFADGARTRVERAETALTKVKWERDQAHREALDARRALRFERSRLEAAHRQELVALHRQIAVLETELDRLRARGELHRDVPYDTGQTDHPGMGRRDIAGEVVTRANRAQRRAAASRQPRR